MTQETQLAKFNPLKASIKKVLEEYKGPIVIVDRKTYLGARNAHTTVGKLIQTVNSIEKELKAPHLLALDNIRSASKELLEELKPLKESLQNSYREWDRKKAEEKAEKERLEKERKERIETAIHLFTKQYTPDTSSMSVFQLMDMMSEVEAEEPHKDFYQEYLPVISLARETALAAIKNAIEISSSAMISRYNELTDSEDGKDIALGKLSEELTRLEALAAQREKDLAMTQEMPDKMLERPLTPKEAYKKDLEPSSVQKTLTDTEKRVLRVWVKSAVFKKAKPKSESQAVMEFTERAEGILGDAVAKTLKELE